jgi:hypothetical protein
LNLLSSPLGRVFVISAVVAGLVLTLTHEWGCDAGLGSSATSEEGRSAQGTIPIPDQGVDDPLLTDARAMAESLGIPVEEAYRRMLIQPAVGVLDARLTQNEASTFAGLYIDQGSDFGVTILTTTSSPNIREHLPTALNPLRQSISCRKVDYTYRELTRAADEFVASAPSARFDSWIDIRTNRIYLNAANDEDARILQESVNDGRFSVPSHAFVVEVGPLAQPGT